MNARHELLTQAKASPKTFQRVIGLAPRNSPKVYYKSVSCFLLSTRSVVFRLRLKISTSFAAIPVFSAASSQKPSIQSIKTVFPPALIYRIKIKRRSMHSSILLLLQVLAFSAIASPLAQLLPVNPGYDPFDATSDAESPVLLYQIAGGLVPDTPPAQPEAHAPLNLLAQPFACTATQLPVPACCPQNVYLAVDPNCIPYSQFSGTGCERDDNVKFRGACCHGFDQTGGIMCQDPSVITNIPQVTYENVNNHWIPSEQQAPITPPNQQLSPGSGSDEQFLSP